MGIFARAYRVFLLAPVVGGLCFAQSGPARQSAVQAILRQLDPEWTGGEGPDSIKCGTTFVAWAFIHRHELPALAKREIARLLERPLREKERLSPSGRFRIHYDTSTVDTPALISTGPSPQRIENTYEQYVDSVATIFEFCLHQETDSLGYAGPPPDGQQGGGPEYDIYIGKLGGLFGQTTWQETDLLEDGPRQRYSTYIDIDNDFLGYRTPGMNGLRVTAAHELFHAIQIGSYGIWNTTPNSDFYFYELSSGWVEDVLFTSVNDYYNVVRWYFESFRDPLGRSLPFTTYDPYRFNGEERSIWDHFLAKRFGRDIVREIWEGMKRAPFLPSTVTVLERQGSTLEAEFARFSSWNFFTADRADTVQFYPEGGHYPRFRPNAIASFNGATATITTSAFPLSTQFYQFVVPGDTVTAVVANINLKQAAESSSIPSSLEIRLAAGSVSPPFQRLSKGYVVGFSSDQVDAWSMLYLESSTRSSASAAAEAAPNPLRLSRDPALSLPIPGATSGNAHVYMLGSSLDLVFSEDYPVTESFGNKMIIVPAGALRSRVPSGVYFVIARCGNQEFKWKVAILQ